MALTVYGASLSPFVRKLCVILKEKNLAYDQVQVDPTRVPEDYQSLSPFKRIPALMDGDKQLADSSIIATYLEAAYPQTSLTYDDPYMRAQVAWFEKFGDYELAPVTTFGIFRNLVLMKMIGQPSDQKLVDKCLYTKLPPLLDYLEANSPDQGFIVGDKLTVADIAIATQFVNMGFAKETIDATRWPKAAAYVNRIQARDSFAELITKETAFVEKMLSKLRK